ncbi:dTDP-4-dehydrorhamnose 3,5-epimerase [Rickettsiales bacterium]|nr:dTDP-4-dehydrorhamnose 3,5-epimerase [Rickettsiales bacterium]
MKVVETGIKDLLVVELDIHGDNRGFFVERYNEKTFKDHGLPTNFVQDNHSRSAPKVVRGLHYQHNPAQGKLVGAARGSIWDVAVDIRPDSPTFGKNFGIELSDANGKLLWVPPGFAHGFCVPGDETVDIFYKVTGLFNSAGEGGISWDDPELAVDWPIKDPILSQRDQNQQSFAEYKDNPPIW